MNLEILLYDIWEKLQFTTSESKILALKKMYKININGALYDLTKDNSVHHISGNIEFNFNLK